MRVCRVSCHDRLSSSPAFLGGRSSVRFCVRQKLFFWLCLGSADVGATPRIGTWPLRNTPAQYYRNFPLVFFFFGPSSIHMYFTLRRRALPRGLHSHFDYGWTDL